MTIFDTGRRHFFRYQLASEAESNQSTPQLMLARTQRSPTLPEKGDAIWVLSRVGSQSPGQYRFAYAFVVDHVNDRHAGLHQFEGRDGLWLAESKLVSGEHWFPAFFRKMGNGGTGMQVIDDAVVQQLARLYRKAETELPDRLDEQQQESGLEQWPEDAIRFGAISARRGQQDFRKRLLAAYRGRCCISGCAVTELLEAAHIRPHASEPCYATRNGLLLRADLHTLFDLGLLSIDSSMRIHLSPKVVDPYYVEMVKSKLRIQVPEKSIDAPSADDLDRRMEIFRKNLATAT